MLINTKEDINNNGKNLCNILRMAGITSIKTRLFVCLVKNLAIIATFVSIQQMVDNKRQEEEMYYKITQNFQIFDESS